MIGKRKPVIDLNTSEREGKLNPLTGKSFGERFYTLLGQRRKLPAWEAKEHLLQLLKTHQIVILQGETGSGKTTQIPQFLIEAGYATKL